MADQTKSIPRRSKARRPQDAPTGPYLLHEGIAIVMGGVALMFFLALVSYTPADLPSWVPFSSRAGDPGSISNFIGPVGAIVAGYAYFFFGAASYLVPAVLAWWGIQVLSGTRVFHGRNFAALAALVGSGACMVEYQTLFFQEWPALYNLPKSAGGFIGYGIGSRVLEHLIGTVGAFITMTIIYGVSLIVITGLHPIRFARLLKDRAAEQIARRDELAAEAMAFASSLARRAAGKASEKTDEWISPKARSKRTAPEREKPRPEPVCEEMELPLEPVLPKPKIIDASMPKRKPDGEKAGSLNSAAAFGNRKEDGKEGAEGGLLAADADKFKDYKLPSLALLSYGNAETAAPTDTSALIDLQNTIVDTLATFGVEVSPGDITKGPTITRYEVYPKPGLRVNRISQLEADLARATKAERISILAPIPGKDTVGIEIANTKKVMVTLRELFEDEVFSESKARIPLALGKDVYGRTIIGDLTQMPHLLVAGATGSGKSVCINSIVASLLYRFTPDQLRFIMIDPKVVEMQLYNKLPHMVVPVVHDPKKVLLALRWVINEMERRYNLFAKLGCRNFDVFNNRQKTREEREAKKAAAAGKNGDKKAAANAAGARPKPMTKAPERSHGTTPRTSPGWRRETTPERETALAVKISENLEPDSMDLFAQPFVLDDDLPAPNPNTRDIRPAGGDGWIPGEEEEATESSVHEEPEPELAAPETGDDAPAHLPYIVVIIDELADLMQTAPADVETAIARIAQKARAAGIHLIVATQTPRADVVTGIIKANIPSRIAFQVASKIDSRVILDAPGADRLVGKGDMLYLPPGSSQLVRAQGALINDEEINDVVEACGSQAAPRFEAGIHESLEDGDEEDGDEVSDADEEILEKCIEVIFQEKKASTSLLQRRLRLGYTRAARMIDILEARGIIGPGDGAKPREVLVDLTDEFA